MPCLLRLWSTRYWLVSKLDHSPSEKPVSTRMADADSAACPANPFSTAGRRGWLVGSTPDRREVDDGALARNCAAANGGLAPAAAIPLRSNQLARAATASSGAVGWCCQTDERPRGALLACTLAENLLVPTGSPTASALANEKGRLAGGPEFAQ